MLHFPTFHTAKSKLEFGETLNNSDPSLRVMSRKGLSSDTALVDDLFCRRQKCLDGDQRKFGKTSMSEQWSKQLRILHTDYAWNVLEQSSAKVWLMCGSHVQKAWRKRYEPGPNSLFQIESLYMPTSEMKLEIGIEFFSPGGAIRRLYIFCPHPESIVWTGGFRNKDSRLDDAYNLAAILTRSEPDWSFGERFYVHQSGRKGVPQRADERQPVVQSGTTLVDTRRTTVEVGAAKAFLRRLAGEAADAEELDDGVRGFLLNKAEDSIDEETQWDVISIVIDKMGTHVPFQRRLDPGTSTIAIDVGNDMPLVKLRVVEIEDDITFLWAELPSSAREGCRRAKINGGTAERLQTKMAKLHIGAVLISSCTREHAKDGGFLEREATSYVKVCTPLQPAWPF
jgi:hypothetical protein